MGKLGSASTDHDEEKGVRDRRRTRSTLHQESVRQETKGGGSPFDQWQPSRSDEEEDGRRRRVGRGGGTLISRCVISPKLRNSPPLFLAHLFKVV